MKRAFTLVEILGVTSLVGILITMTAIGINRAWQNNCIDVCESELRDMTTGLKSYFTDYGNIVIAPDMNYENVLNETIDLLNKQYLTCEFEVDEIAADKKSAKISTKIKTDPWNNKYNAAIYTYDGEDKFGIPGLVIISSSGKDGQSSATTYKDSNYGDDIIAVVEPK